VPVVRSLLGSSQMLVRATEPESIRDKLIADHARLEKLFRDVLERLALDDRDETRGAWRDFERAVLAHLDAEEKLVLPAFAAAHPDEARALRVEHRRIRARLLELGVAVDLHCIRVSMASDFVAELRDHARREDALLYRWADENLAEAVRAALARRIVPRI
jgi:hypothetical protein